MGATFEEVEEHMQEVADSKKTRNDRPAIGPLTFKRFYNGASRQVHGFFIGHDGKKRRFMKVEEEQPVHPRCRFLGIVMAWQRFVCEPGRALDMHDVLTLSDLDALESILMRLSGGMMIADGGDNTGELYRCGEAMRADLARCAEL
jgi:hypothetical protein